MKSNNSCKEDKRDPKKDALIMRKVIMERFRKYNFAIVLAAISIAASSVAGCGEASSGISSVISTTEASGETSSQETVSKETSFGATSEAATADSTETVSAASSVSDTEEDLSIDEVHTNPNDLTKVDVSKDIDVPSTGNSSISTDESASENSSYENTDQKKTWPDLGTIGPDDYVKDAAGHQPHVLVLGDSQFDNNRTADGLAQKVASYSHCRVYNCAIGGTGASPTAGYTDWNYSDWTSNCFVGMALAASGKGNAEKICGKHYAYQVLKGCDLNDVDVIVVEYGVNDYFQDSPISGDGMKSYLGSLNAGVGVLGDAFPNATIILCNPTYAQFFSNDTYVGDSNMLSNSYGPMIDYALSMVKYAQDHNFSYFNAYQWTNISAVNAADYLEDGVHLNHYGRELYAQFLARTILRSLGYSIPEGADMSTFDFSTLQKTNDAQ